jgi:hypothetical protein
LRLHRLFTLALVAARCLSAQDLHFGVKGGVPVTQYFDTGQAGNLRLAPNQAEVLVGLLF